MARNPAAPRIVWFRDDLRLSDHPALHAACDASAPVICLYVLDEQSPALRAPAARPPGGAARWWLAQSLRALQERLGTLGMPLLLRRGAAARVITELARETGADAVFWNEIAQAPHQAVAEQLAAGLREIGIAAHSFFGDLLVAPVNIRNKENRGLRVFTPFWKRVLRSGNPPAAAAGADAAGAPCRASAATASKAGVLNRPARTGPADCAKRGGRASRRPGSQLARVP